MEKKNIVITGGLGYVGGRLSKHFADLGHQVYALSRSKTINYPNITVYKNEDLLNSNVLRNIKVDALIHLAATNEIICSNEPQKSNVVNINGTIDWLEWALKNQVNQFIYFSTVHVYARPLIGSFDESSFCSPNHPYSISHKAAEDYALWYKTEFGLNTKIVRLSNSFGFPAFNSADRWTLFVNDICMQLVKNKSFEIKSNILQHRDFISLSEVCDAIECLIDSHTSIEESIFNLCKGYSISLAEMAKLVKEVAEDYFSTEITIKFNESKSKPSEQIHISNQNFNKIGWIPNEQYSKNEIMKTIDYFITNGSSKSTSDLN